MRAIREGDMVRFAERTSVECFDGEYVFGAGRHERVIALRSRDGHTRAVQVRTPCRGRTVWVPVRVVELVPRESKTPQQEVAA
jgi:hypothetical protein